MAQGLQLVLQDALKDKVTLQVCRHSLNGEHIEFIITTPSSEGDLVSRIQIDERQAETLAMILQVL